MVCRDAQTVSRDFDLPVAWHWLLCRQVQLSWHWTGCRDVNADRGGDYRPNRHHDLASGQVGFLPDVPVRRWLWRGAAVRTRYCVGWVAASAVCGGGMRVLPDCPCRGGETGGIRPGL